MELQHISPSDSSHFRTIKRQASFELDLEPVITCGSLGSVTVIRPQPRTPSLDLERSEEKNIQIDFSTPSDLSESCASSVNSQTPESSFSTSLNKSICDIDSKESSVVFSTVIDAFSKTSIDSLAIPENEQKLSKQQKDRIVTTTDLSIVESCNPQEQGALSQPSSGPVSEGDSGIDPCAEGEAVSSGPGGVDGLNSGPLTNDNDSIVEIRASGVSWTATETLVNSSEASTKMEHRDKKKGSVLLIKLYFVFQ